MHFARPAAVEDPVEIRGDNQSQAEAPVNEAFVQGAGFTEVVHQGEVGGVHQAVDQGPGEGGAILIDNGEGDILGVEGEAEAEEDEEQERNAEGEGEVKFIPDDFFGFLPGHGQEPAVKRHRSRPA